MDLSGLPRTLTFGTFIGGLVAWTLGTALTFGLVAAIWVVAVVTLVGAGIVAVRMYETHPSRGAAADRVASPTMGY